MSTTEDAADGEKSLVAVTMGQRWYAFGAICERCAQPLPRREEVMEAQS